MQGAKLFVAHLTTFCLIVTGLAIIDKTHEFDTYEFRVPRVVAFRVGIYLIVLITYGHGAPF